LTVKGIRNVIPHEPLNDIRRLIFLQFALGTPRSEIWRGLNNAAVFRAEQDRHRGERQRQSAKCRYRVLVARLPATVR
jgi:hypothetical protein